LQKNSFEQLFPATASRAGTPPSPWVIVRFGVAAIGQSVLCNKNVAFHFSEPITAREQQTLGQQFSFLKAHDQSLA
jgi:hypothetical protein